MIGGEAILTAAQMRAAEQVIFDIGVSEYALMERAGAAAAEIIWRIGARRDVLVLAGPGNNGGDGFVIARHLRAQGVSVRVAALGEGRSDAGKQARAAWDGPVEDFMTAQPAVQVVDALFGTGLKRSLDDAVTARLTELVKASTRSYAIDLPSGVDTDVGRCLSRLPRFNICIAIGALKPAHLLQPAAHICGQLILADIGVDTTLAPMRALVLPKLKAPAIDAHKYRRGLVAVIAGKMPGASVLAANAAARGGAGYVKIAGEAPHGLFDAIVQDGDAINDRRVSVMLIGPGLGRGKAAREQMCDVMVAGKPMVIDADALVALKDLGLAGVPLGSVLTPHEGEFVTLFGNMEGSKIDRALTAARIAGAVIVYKGADTVIAAPDGRVAMAWGAPSWLSTAGTGDVLAGIAAARLAVTGDSFRAACEAVWLHQDAARRAGAAFAADDLLAHIPAAIASRL